MAESKYTILIICEGEKTEPLFFNSIRDELIDNKHDNDIRNLRITIAPEPLIEDEELENINIKHKPKRKKRETKPVVKIDNIKIINGKPPLRWVLTAKRELKTGAFDEVWAVFDNDDHPSKKEAFEEAKEIINGNTVKIAYSSRSFEYYLLIHFDKSYKKFGKTDCKFKEDKKNIFIRCGTNEYQNKDCNGSICINGYAQSKGFWKNSDDDNTKKSETYTLVKDKLDIGFENSSWIRYKSNLNQPGIPIWDRNPYLSVDKLVKKLIGNDTSYKWIELDKEYKFTEFNILVNSKDTILTLTNTSKKTIIIPENLIMVESKKKSIFIGERQVLKINETTNFNLSDYKSKENWFKLTYEKHVIMFENKA